MGKNENDNPVENSELIRRLPNRPTARAGTAVPGSPLSTPPHPCRTGPPQQVNYADGIAPDRYRVMSDGRSSRLEEFRQENSGDRENSGDSISISSAAPSSPPSAPPPTAPDGAGTAALPNRASFIESLVHCGL